MLKISPQRKVQFVTLERRNAWVVVAFLTEIRGEETVVVSAPKVVKVILKQSAALPGGNEQAILALPAPISTAFAVLKPVVSPFASNIFGFSNSDFVVSLAARPPTIS